MVFKLADNVFSPLGESTEDNYVALRQGVTRLFLHHSQDIPEAFMASLFDSRFREKIANGEGTLFEAIAEISIKKALADTKIDVTKDNVILILSTTKGNVTKLFVKESCPEQILPGVNAKRIAKKIGVKADPIVACNACISGLSAIILAQRLLECGTYDYAIVCGVDVISRFSVSGFQSLMVLSSEECRPFDMERGGLNLGEAAATIIFGNKSYDNSSKQWMVEMGAVRNDASHISTPSKKGDGLYLALSKVTKKKKKDEIALINAHGTGTLFNDAMESVAIRKAGLSGLPVNALKGWFGHTMGASGILETILTMRALDDGIILGTRGFKELGVSGDLDISPNERHTNKRSFIKTLSGFGGCNAAIVVSRASQPFISEMIVNQPLTLKQIHSVEIKTSCVIVDGGRIETVGTGNELITFLYREYVRDYPKFYKMDMLSRLGFVASELLLLAEGKERFVEREDRAIVFFNRSSSISADKKYLATIDQDNYFPSPALFVYTLPNIVNGEIAIRNKYYGETSFYILPEEDEKQIIAVLETLFIDKSTKSVLGGWLDYESECNFTAKISIFEPQNER